MKKKLVKNGIPRSWIMIFYPHYMKGRKKIPQRIIHPARGGSQLLK
jgi:hypothetical protein